MEIILAVIVGVAVIFFGVLISMGNERQRKAIDVLREQVVFWAIQDLRIKRETLARNVKVDNPIGWLNRIVTKISGYDLNLRAIESFDEPRALICVIGETNCTVIFSPLSPSEISQIKKNKLSRLSRYNDRNPLLSLPRGIKLYELSVLNSGILFDLELPLTWRDLTGQEVESMDSMWMYIID